MTDIAYFDQNARRSRAVTHAGTAYIAGQTADDRTADIAGQTRQVLAKIDEMLAHAGTHKGKLLSTTIWLSSMSHFAGMNEIYDSWVVQGAAPARACCTVELAAADILVEITAVAAI